MTDYQVIKSMTVQGCVNAHELPLVEPQYTDCFLSKGTVLRDVKFYPRKDSDLVDLTARGYKPLVGVHANCLVERNDADLHRLMQILRPNEIDLKSHFFRTFPGAEKIIVEAIVRYCQTDNGNSWLGFSAKDFVESCNLASHLEGWHQLIVGYDIFIENEGKDNNYAYNKIHFTKDLQEGDMIFVLPQFVAKLANHVRAN